MDVTQDACVQTERIVSDEERALLDKVDTLQSLLKEKYQQFTKQKFCLMNIKDDDTQIVTEEIIISSRPHG